MYLSVYDSKFKNLQNIKVSEKVCTQGNLAVYDNKLLMVYNEKEIPAEMSSADPRAKSQFAASKSDIIMKIFAISE